MSTLVGNSGEAYPTELTMAEGKPLYMFCVAEHSGTLEKVETFLHGGTATEIEMGITLAKPAEHAEYPGALIAESKRTTGAISADAWAEAKGLSVAVTAGSEYWLGLVGVNGTLIVKFEAKAGSKLNEYKYSFIGTIASNKVKKLEEVKGSMLEGEGGEADEQIFGIRGVGTETAGGGKGLGMLL